MATVTATVTAVLSGTRVLRPLTSPRGHARDTGDSFTVDLPSGPATVVLSNITAPRLGRYKVENAPGIPHACVSRTEVLLPHPLPLSHPLCLARNVHVVRSWRMIALLHSCF